MPTRQWSLLGSQHAVLGTRQYPDPCAMPYPYPIPARPFFRTQSAASIMDIHKAKPAATVSYSKRMPEIEALMQEWPPEVEAFLKTMKMPSGDVVSAMCP